MPRKNYNLRVNLSYDLYFLFTSSLKKSNIKLPTNERNGDTMKRFCFRGQYKDEAVLSYVTTQKQHIEGLLREGKIYTVTVFSYDNQNLFVYYES